MTEGAIIQLPEWLKTPAGAYLLAWEQRHLDPAVADVFGFHALQLGLPQLDALRANRMPHRWLAVDTPPRDDVLPATERSADAAGMASNVDSIRSVVQSIVGSTPLSPDEPSPTASRSDATSAIITPGASLVRPALHTRFDALPFDAASLDLVVLPHALEMSCDPHRVLREVERVLVPEGRVLIVGFNPASLWGTRQRLGHLRRRVGLGPARELFLPHAGEFIGQRRLRDWLRLLSFEIESGRFGCYIPPVSSARWLARFGWMEDAGNRWWPVFGALYYIVAVKRVRGMRLIGLARNEARPKTSAAPAPAAATHRTLELELHGDEK